MCFIGNNFMDNQFKKFQNVSIAYEFIRELGAPPKLILHVQLVGEAAELLISKLHELKVSFDENFVRLGVAFHDTGKIIYPEELNQTGTNHEAEGEALLIANGIDPNLARCCRSHGQWQTIECSFEELCVAISDTLWKGKRNPQLEGSFLKMLSTQCDKDYWDLFIEMDGCFESIASDGHSRLLRSQII